MSLTLLLSLLFLSFCLGLYSVFRGVSRSVEGYAHHVSVRAQSGSWKVVNQHSTKTVFLICTLLFAALVACLVFIRPNGMAMLGLVLLLLLIPRWGLRYLAQRRKRLISEAMPDALSQISGAMKAGSTFLSAVQAFAENDSGPLGQEFSLLVREQRVGARLDDALDSMAERVQSEEMDLVVSAALIANEVGGNLADVFLSLSDTLRRKLEMEGKIDSLTAQGRLQGRVVGALPFLILLPLLYFEKEATLPIFNSLLGWIFLTLIIVMDVIGSLWINKIVSIEI